MRPTLKEELEYALWKITGMPLRFDDQVIPCLSREISKKTGEDSAVIGQRLIQQIQMIVNEDVDRQMNRCRPCRKHPLKP
ncbi:MAG: hypothetical protein GKC05_03145 [Methanomicrobiales archaeon]|nr:hypothetical protein [Methanomicrobiales archaeon]NYT21065.1 hypothetical protein [Methanomicrobiales archaeon]